MRNKNLIKFGSRLKELRIAEKKTQSNMADLLGCSVSNYQKIEYGEINIPILNLMILAVYFGVTTDYLLGRTDEGGPAE